MYLVGTVIKFPHNQVFENMVLFPAMFLFAVLAVTTISLVLCFMGAVAVGICMYLIDD